MYPDTQTLSFYGSSYTSAYIDFQPVEEATNQPAGDGYQTLQTPTAAQSALVAKYDTQGSIPLPRYRQPLPHHRFELLAAGAAGAVRSQIAADLSDPGSAVAQAINGTANDITAAVAAVTGKPALQRRQFGDDCGDRPEASGPDGGAYGHPVKCQARYLSRRSACRSPRGGRVVPHG